MTQSAVERASQTYASRARATHDLLAYAGLMIGLAVLALFVPIAPSDALGAGVGGVILAAGLAGILTLSMARGWELPFRGLWSCGALVAGAVLLWPLPFPVIELKAVLAGAFLVQGLAIAIFALRHRGEHALGLPLVAAASVMTAILAAFIWLAYPFGAAWLLGAVVAISLLDYAAALIFAAETGSRPV